MELTLHTFADGELCWVLSRRILVRLLLDIA